MQSLQVQPEGFQSFILDLNADKDDESLISFGTNSHVFGPLYLIVSRPLLTVFALGITHSFLPRTAEAEWEEKCYRTYEISRGAKYHTLFFYKKPLDKIGLKVS